MDKDTLEALGFMVLGGIIGALITLIAILSVPISDYKEGQLDFQRGKVEWVLSPDGSIWHKEKVNDR